MTEFEEVFGTPEENMEFARQARERDARHEDECVRGLRARCSCGAPAIYVGEQGPRCAPCGYGDPE